MSWGVQAIGYAPAVRRLVRDWFSSSKPCPEIEENIRRGTAELADATLATFAPETVVKVDCRGSLCMQEWETQTGITQNVILVIEPVHNFIDAKGEKHG